MYVIPAFFCFRRSFFLISFATDKSSASPVSPRKYFSEANLSSLSLPILGYPITDIAISGNVLYRVHVKKGNRWLPWVDGKNYNLHDYENGYAGNGSIIDALEIKRY